MANAWVSLIPKPQRVIGLLPLCRAPRARSPSLMANAWVSKIPKPVWGYRGKGPYAGVPPHTTEKKA